MVEVYQAKYEWVVKGEDSKDAGASEGEDVECITSEMMHKFPFGKRVSKQDDEEHGLHHFVS